VYWLVSAPGLAFPGLLLLGWLFLVEVGVPPFWPITLQPRTRVRLWGRLLLAFPIRFGVLRPERRVRHEAANALHTGARITCPFSQLCFGGEVLRRVGRLGGVCGLGRGGSWGFRGDESQVGVVRSLTGMTFFYCSLFLAPRVSTVL